METNSSPANKIFDPADAESFSGAVHSTPVSCEASSTGALPVADISCNLDFDSSHLENSSHGQVEMNAKVDAIDEANPGSISGDRTNIQTGEASWSGDSGLQTCGENNVEVSQLSVGEQHHVDDVEWARGETSLVCSAVSENQDVVVNQAQVERSQPTESLDFKKGITCSDVPSALEVLKTHYKLADVSFRRHDLSWSSWNIADMVRGPHRESYYWRTRGGETRLNAVNSMQSAEAERSTCVEPVKSDGLTLDEEMEEICTKIELKDKEIALMLKKILDQDEKTSKDLELLTVKTEPSNTLNRRINVELNSSPKRRENAFQRLMRAIRKRFSSRGKSPNRTGKDTDRHLDSPDTPTKSDKSGERLSLRGSFRQKFINLRRSNSERAQKSTDKSLIDTNVSPRGKESKKRDAKKSPKDASSDKNLASTDLHAETAAAADLLMSLDTSEPLTCGDITILVPQGHITTSTRQNDESKSEKLSNAEKSSDDKLPIEAPVIEIHDYDKKKEDLHAGAELLMLSENVNLVESQPLQAELSLSCESQPNNEEEILIHSKDSQVGNNVIIEAESFKVESGNTEQTNLEEFNASLEIGSNEVQYVEAGDDSVLQDSSNVEQHVQSGELVGPSSNNFSEPNTVLDASVNLTMCQESDPNTDHEKENDRELELTQNYSNVNESVSGDSEANLINVSEDVTDLLGNIGSGLEASTDTNAEENNDINFNSNIDQQYDQQDDLQQRNHEQIEHDMHDISSHDNDLLLDSEMNLSNSQMTGELKVNFDEQLLGITQSSGFVGDLQMDEAGVRIENHESESHAEITHKAADSK